ncbi:AzlC family ABC transporter permease [cf. Phormidesmis sp. LEGE 11477]|uniref:AzlC family ABC transporter permease n=1 Tax=cf. Phormidesmis sp. LEGE 11477 TaxID=1828680 RepID=UPI00187F5AFD|nr:AzlC family ABC transporter permease [cf. Phormidesmis sp. LEGE 11477]MBE9059528.1 AzlC family ABC transporter permease [cf. Phormidesmis sp. LEGE 11477]
MSKFLSKGKPLIDPSPSTEFWAGARDIIPLVVGAVPFGIIFGTLATTAGLSPSGTLAMSIFVFAGSSQFIAAGLIAAKTNWLLIVLTTFVVNLRHLLYAVSLLPYAKKLPQMWKMLMAFWLTDESFAVGIRRYESNEQSAFKHWYYIGAALTMYLNWQLCTLLGITTGQLVPNAAEWGLDFAMSVTFIGMVVPYVKNKPMGIAVIVAGVIAVLGYGMPHKLGLMAAAIAGIIAGVLSEKAIEPTASIKN